MKVQKDTCGACSWFDGKCTNPNSLYKNSPVVHNARFTNCPSDNVRYFDYTNLVEDKFDASKDSFFLTEEDFGNKEEPEK